MRDTEVVGAIRERFLSLVAVLGERVRRQWAEAEAVVTSQQKGTSLPVFSRGRMNVLTPMGSNTR